MATILRAKGHLREAEGFYIQAINMMEECDSTPWGIELSSLYANLAALYSAASMPEASVRMQEKSLEILERAVPPAALLDRLRCLKQLEAFYRRAGMVTAAADCAARPCGSRSTPRGNLRDKPRLAGIRARSCHAPPKICSSYDPGSPRLSFVIC